jgi:uncharacterized protein YybS (DUF2232 family)
MQRLWVIGRSLLALGSSLFLFMGGVMIPPVGFLLLPFVPQPALSLGVKDGIVRGVAVLAAGVLLLAAFAGKEVAYIYGLFALLAVLLFALLGRLRAIEYLVTAVAATVFAAAGALLVHMFGSWGAMMRELRASLMQHMTSALSAYEKMGLSKESLDLLKEQIPHIAETMFQLLPGLVFLSLAMVVLINVFFLCRRFPDRRGEWLSLNSLREWKGPEPLVWGLIACGFALFVPGLESLKVLALNVLLVIGACYFAQGLAIIAFFFHKNNVPRFLRGVTYVLIVFQQILTLLVVVLGLIDLWGDFRRLGKNNLKPSQVS